MASEYTTRLCEQRKTVDMAQAELTLAQREIEQLRATIVMLQAQQEYVYHSQELLQYRERYDYSSALHAQIMSRSCSVAEHTMIVDAGSNRGIYEGMIAVVGNAIIGRVIEVFPWYSRLLLVTDKRCKIPVVSVTTHTDGIYEGANSLVEGKLLFVSCLEQLNPGDLLITSGKGMLYPAGFAVGTVETVAQDPQGLYYSATIRPHHDLLKLTHCVLLKRDSL